jgi:polyphosphate kinase
VYYFRNGGDEEILLGSADMMQRNLDHRVETLFPIEDSVIREAILERLLKSELADTANARELKPDGSYVRVQPAEGEAPFDAQAWFMTHSLLGSDAERYNHVISAKPSGA